MQEITDRIRAEASRLFQEDKVDVVIGYQQGWDEDQATPCFITEESQVDRLIFSEYCTHNLAKYLVGREGYLTSHFRPADAVPRVALIATPAALRAVVGLIQEHQFHREDLIVLGLVDGTPVGTEPDIELGRVEPDAEDQEAVRAQIEALDEMSESERWEWWEREFSKCIRCYACRQVCPLCFCEQCIVDENRPQWIGRSPTPENNRSWNLIRAFHLLGRCIGCGECDRACPVGIPLKALNTKLADEVKEEYGYVAGSDMEEPPPLETFKVQDPEHHFR